MTKKEKERLAIAIAILEEALSMSDKDAQAFFRVTKEEAIANALKHLKQIAFGDDPSANTGEV